MRTVRAEVARRAGDAPFAIVEWEGFQWLVVEVDTASGVTVLERGVPDDTLPTGRVPLVVEPQPRFSGVVAVAVCAVFLFLALLVQIGTRLTFADVVGCIVGFVILVLLLDRRERPRDRSRWLWL